MIRTSQISYAEDLIILKVPLVCFDIGLQSDLYLES